MQYIWSTLSMLQLITHTRFLEVPIPAPCQILFQQLNQISNMKFHKIPIVRDYLLKHSRKVINIIKKVGMVTCTMIGVISLIIILSVLQILTRRFEKVQAFVIKIKRKLMWSSVLRSLMQGYFAMSLLHLTKFSKHPTEFSLESSQSFLTFLVVLVFPVLITRYFKRNKDSLQDKIFKESYGSVYQNIRVLKLSNKGNINWIPIYLYKRLLLVIITIWVKDFVWL